ncbi:MAG: HepT-like ribonuclease domain-containing protein [Planctomycetota bacterium]
MAAFFRNMLKLTGKELGLRDIIAHQYFDIDAEEVFWICAHEVTPLSATIKKMLGGIGSLKIMRL